MPRPTPRALVVAALGLAAALLPALLSPHVAAELRAPLALVWIACWGLFALLFAADLVLAPAPRRLRLAVTLPPLLVVDEAGEGTIDAAFGGRHRRLAAALVLDLSEHLEPLPARRFRWPADGVRLAVPLTPRRRGTAAIEAIWLSWDGPLGLVRTTVRRDPEAVVRVTPASRAAGARALRHLSLRRALPGQRIERYVGQGTEFHALREWVPGLDRRDVDWKASARHTRLLAREQRAERNHQIVLALDTGRLMAEPVAGLPLLDHAIHAALELATVGLRSGDRVGLYAFDDRPRAYAPPRGGRAAMGGLVRLAAGLDYSHAETSFTLGLTELSRRLNRRSLVVVLTDFVDAITADLMVDNLIRLRRHQLVLFVAFRDPTLGDLVAAPPAGRDDLDRAVVAGALARDRRQVLGRLAERGVQVLDAPPRQVGAGLIDRYLEIKRREMI